ncbi:hypothetical protein MANES_08G133700v8 [Manihot esculenta]|uniref:NADP-dependent oxidoreductase domain-containing protein n=1 Tax=Manihot esculenta TaxID=3983 RepID=A0A2C9VFZ1_MANES|nr:hypothetical protein MANES_08G133700v8 [Manihot esculenta]
MAEEQRLVIPKVKLGNQGLEVSKLGFGCMGLSGGYDAPVPEEVGISIMKEAFDKGITFFDTADIYGEKIQLATKFGIMFKSNDFKTPSFNGKPEYVRACCEASLKRLDVDYIDLYYQHRVDPSVPIEETGKLKKLVEEGKIKYIGLSEPSPDTIKRAHTVHPITALQMEWSIWSRELEEEIIPLCRELGIGIVPYSPLGQGFFAGKAVRLLPRFTEENLEHNKVLYSRVENLARKYGCSPAQLALAWVLNQGDDVVPIPGTTKIKNLEDNIGALRVKLTKDEFKEVSDAVPADQVAGFRTVDIRHTWKFGNTPPRV